MSGQTKTSVILGAFLVNPDLRPEDFGIKKSFFQSTNERLVFSHMDGSRDLAIIADKIGPKIRDCHSYLSTLLNGIHKGGAEPERVKILVNEVRKERLQKEIIQLISEGSKIGLYQHEKIRDLYQQIDSLSLIHDLNQYHKIKEIDPAAISWLWWNRISRGSYSAICGDPGDGKSILLIDIFAKITSGKPLPDRQGLDPHGSVIYFTAEDGLADTVRVRAEDADCDLGKFIVNTGLKSDGSFFSLANPEDLRSLENQIKTLGDVQAIGFDPISTYLSGIRGNVESEVRAALAPLSRMAEKYQISIIGIGHLNKDQAKAALYRLSGSIAFVAVARTVWLVRKDEDSDQRYFAPLKYNICKDPTTLAFRIDGPIGRPTVEFDPIPVDITSEELLADEDARDRMSAVAEARLFLDEILPPGSEMLQKEIMNDAKSDGHAKRTIHRAKKQLNIQSEQKGRLWWWKRPEK